MQTGRTKLDGVAQAAPDARARLRRQPGRGALHRPRRARPWLRPRRAPLRGRLASLPRLAEGAPALGALARDHLRRVADDARRPRGQDVPRRLGRLAVACRGSGARASPSRPTPTTWSGRATSTRSPPRCSRPATAPARCARVDYLFDRQQKPDGCFPQNSTVDGQPKWTNLQLDEVAFPIVLAWQLGRRDAATYAHVKRAVGCLLANGPQQPAGALGEPGRLVAGHDRLRDRRARDRRRPRERQPRRRERDGVAGDRRRVAVARSTAGPPRQPARTRPQPYYLRNLEQDTATRTRARTTTSATPAPSRSTSARSPTRASSSSCASASSPRLTRSSATRSASSTSGSAVDTPNGAFWHRYDFDGYGEKKDGSNWDIGQPVNPTEDWANNATIGRIWPIFAGERGEYELLSRRPRVGARAPWLDRRHRRARPHDRRAGVGPVPALRLRGLPARRGHAVRPAAGVVARPARAARVVGGGGRPVEQPAIVARSTQRRALRGWVRAPQSD